MGAGASLQAPEGKAFSQGTVAADATTVEKGVQVTPAIESVLCAFKARVLSALAWLRFPFHFPIRA